VRRDDKSNDVSERQTPDGAICGPARRVLAVVQRVDWAARCTGRCQWWRSWRQYGLDCHECHYVETAHHL